MSLDSYKNVCVVINDVCSIFAIVYMCVNMSQICDYCCMPMPFLITVLCVYRN